MVIDSVAARSPAEVRSRKSPTPTNIAAPAPMPLNIATICGIAVICTARDT